MARASASVRGFTMLEVLVAVLVVGLAFGVLLSWTSQNARRLHHTRLEAVAARLAERQARQILVDLQAGMQLDNGSERGEFDEPEYADFGWEVSVEPYAFALPASFGDAAAPSPLFEPSAGQRQRPEPVLQRVTVSVFALVDDEPLIDPFVLFAVERAEGAPAALAEDTPEPPPTAPPEQAR